MEHRCDHRKQLSLEVVLHDRNLGKIQGRTRNVSLSGMLIEIDETSLKLSTIVDVSFPVTSGSESRKCSAKAYVVYQQSDRLGLMFSEIDSDVRQMLRKELFGYATLAERAYLSHKGLDGAKARAVA